MITLSEHNPFCLNVSKHFAIKTCVVQSGVSVNATPISEMLIPCFGHLPNMDPHSNHLDAWLTFPNRLSSLSEEKWCVAFSISLILFLFPPSMVVELQREEKTNTN